MEQLAGHWPLHTPRHWPPHTHNSTWVVTLLHPKKSRENPFMCVILRNVNNTLEKRFSSNGPWAYSVDAIFKYVNKAHYCIKPKAGFLSSGTKLGFLEWCPNVVVFLVLHLPLTKCPENKIMILTSSFYPGRSCLRPTSYPRIDGSSP